MFEAVGSYAAGKITKEELDEFENKTCPTCGSCSGMYTANSMNCLTEVLGMGLQGNGKNPYCKTCRYEGYGIIREEYPPKRYLNRESV